MCTGKNFFYCSKEVVFIIIRKKCESFILLGSFMFFFQAMLIKTTCNTYIRTIIIKGEEGEYRVGSILGPHQLGVR